MKIFPIRDIVLTGFETNSEGRIVCYLSPCSSQMCVHRFADTLTMLVQDPKMDHDHFVLCTGTSYLVVCLTC